MELNETSIHENNHEGKYYIIPEDVLQGNGGSLTMVEAALYSYITRLIHKKHGYCWSTNQHFATHFHTCTRTIKYRVKKLQQEGYITITLEKNNYRKIYLYGNRQTFETNTTTDTQSAEKTQTKGVSAANTTTSRKKDTPSEYTTEENKEIADVIHAFAWHENELYAKRLFGMKVQRVAAHELIRKYGYEYLVNFIPNLQQTNRRPFFPTIISPLQLLNKHGSLVSALAAEKHKQENPDRRRSGVRIAGQ